MHIQSGRVLDLINYKHRKESEARLRAITQRWDAAKREQKEYDEEYKRWETEKKEAKLKKDQIDEWNRNRKEEDEAAKKKRKSCSPKHAGGQSQPGGGSQASSSGCKNWDLQCVRDVAIWFYAVETSKDSLIGMYCEICIEGTAPHASGHGKHNVLAACAACAEEMWAGHAMAEEKLHKCCKDPKH